MGKFCLPEVLRVGTLPVIVYADENINGLLSRQDPQSIQKYLDRLYHRVEKLGGGFVDINILWEDNKDLITDVWSIIGSRWSSSRLSTKRTFRRNQQGTFVLDGHHDTSAKYILSVIGRELEYLCFGSLKGRHPAFDEYLKNRYLPYIQKLLMEKDFINHNFLNSFSVI